MTEQELKGRLEKFFEELLTLSFPESEQKHNRRSPIAVFTTTSTLRVEKETLIQWIIDVSKGNRHYVEIRLDTYNLQLYWDMFRGKLFFQVHGHDSWPKAEELINELISKHGFQL